MVKVVFDVYYVRVGYKFIDGEYMKIRWLRVKNPEDFGQYEKYISCVSGERRERVNRIKNNKGKSISLMAEVFMRQEIGRSLGMGKDEVVFSYTEHGKPYVKAEGEYFFSISHTENIIVFTDSSVPVGIDVERIKEAKLKVAKRFFTEAENGRILSFASPDCDREFYRIWTMKEAYLKMTGQGLLVPLNSFDVDSGENDVFFHNEIYDGFSISVCRAGSEPEEVEIAESGIE